MANQITIIGGGIAGLCAAIALKKIGLKPIVFEAAPTIKPVGAGLAMSANAVKALDKMGIKEKVLGVSKIIPQVLIKNAHGEIIVDNDLNTGTDEVNNFAVHRADLHRILLSCLDDTTVFTNKKVIDFEQHDQHVILKFQDGTHHITNYLLVADGIHSTIRKKLIPDSEYRYSGYTCWRGIATKEYFDLPYGSESWGSNGRFGILPIPDGRVYWFACINANERDETLKKYKSNDILKLFKSYHDPIPSIIQATPDDLIIWNDIIDIKPIPTYAFSNIVLIGDAAHATTPNMGQGACQAIEDAIVLADEIANTADMNHAFKKYERRRKKRTQNIVKASWNLGKIAQLENPLLIALRNQILKWIPKSISERNLAKLYKVDF